MALPTDLRPASFRNVPFEAREAGLSTGRRVVVFEYPQADTPSTEDLGRKARRFTLQAFLVGDDARARKRALIAACEASNSGILIHPTEGQMRVQCESCDVTESSDGVNYVEFSMGFVEAGTVSDFGISTASQAASLGAQLRTAVRTFYAARLQVTSFTRKVHRFLTGSVEERLQALLQMVTQLTGIDTSALQYATAVVADTYETGIEDAELAAEQWQDIVRAFRGTSEEPWTESENLRKVAANTGDALADTWLASADTEQDQLALDSIALTNLTLHASVLADAAELASQAGYASYDDAIAAQTDLADRLADLEGYVDDADLLGALRDLRIAMVQAIQGDALDLPRLRSLTVPVPTCALSLAYDLYGDSARADEIVARNNLADPNAVSGSLLVLTE